MAEYTYKDVIIDPEDPRVEIGAEYCFGDIPQNLVEAANSDHYFWVRLEKVSVSDGFNFKKEGGGWKSCIIRKKEPEKKYVPFDLSKEEDRAKLRGAWVRVKERTSWEEQITSLNSIFIFLGRDGEDGIKPDYLFNHYEFVDGTPCGILKGVTDD